MCPSRLGPGGYIRDGNWDRIWDMDRRWSGYDHGLGFPGRYEDMTVMKTGSGRCARAYHDGRAQTTLDASAGRHVFTQLGPRNRQRRAVMIYFVPNTDRPRNPMGLFLNFP